MAELYRSVYDLISALSKRANFSLEAGSQTRSEIAEMKTSSLRFALIAVLLAISMVAVSQENFLAEEVNLSILKLQEEADSAYAKGDYESALKLYQQELAPLGDKYSQYMVGYLHLVGKGVQEDAILASAWYRLAAQRGTEQYIRIRDSLLALCNDEQISRSDLLYINLRREIGDLVLVNKLIRDDMKLLRRRTGSPFYLQGAMRGAIDRDVIGRQIDAKDAAAERINSRVEMLNRQIALEKTLDDSERDTFSRLLKDAKSAVDAYKTSR